MTLPYVWYRTSVWIPLGTAVNNFWVFLVIFWKVPAIVRPAAYSAKLEPPLGRPLNLSFPVNYFQTVFFFFSSWLILHEWWQPGCWWYFSVHLIPFFLYSFLFFYPLTATPQSPAHTSETSAERLALACERVHADNAMHYVSTAFVWNAAAVILASL